MLGHQLTVNERFRGHRSPGIQAPAIQPDLRRLAVQHEAIMQEHELRFHALKERRHGFRADRCRRFLLFDHYFSQCFHGLPSLCAPDTAGASSGHLDLTFQAISNKVPAMQTETKKPVELLPELVGTVSLEEWATFQRVQKLAFTVYRQRTWAKNLSKRADRAEMKELTKAQKKRVSKRAIRMQHLRLISEDVRKNFDPKGVALSEAFRQAEQGNAP